jgi:outer membrane usher protein FimD/PapC
VKKADGSVDEWMVEAGTPNTLLRRGLTRQALPVGTEITVDGYQSKDGSLRANGRDLTLPNGQTLFIGSSGTGAPTDEKKK